MFGAGCSSYLVLAFGRTYPVRELALKKDFLDFFGWESKSQGSYISLEMSCSFYWGFLAFV